jgi:hypothetical protein
VLLSVIYKTRYSLCQPGNPSTQDISQVKSMKIKTILFWIFLKNLKLELIRVSSSTPILILSRVDCWISCYYYSTTFFLSFTLVIANFCISYLYLFFWFIAGYIVPWGENIDRAYVCKAMASRVTQKIKINISSSSCMIRR